MLLNLVIKSVNYFQDDCRVLCQKHYPTVHNKGMDEHHLGLAFARRMQHTFSQFGHQSSIHPVDISSQQDLPHHYRISSDIGTVWVLSHHMVSAGKVCRENLLASIAKWQCEYVYSLQPNDLLFLVTDHWFNRSKTSRELIHWWMGELPKPLKDYVEQGINLYAGDSTLINSLEQRFSISPCYLNFAHPLRRNHDQRQVRKYIQLYTVLQW
ncbi:hypothetical protein [Vibrio sagamiensis]|uniref:Uncharacterized protein n=1 Tax=Vibrio sagamiensis NBRC 104589 TaxID=1219064 RepID=A0A511QFQ7_9VIBR|nr:hypothetical protein [Vibrio sagamiensis]PNQ54361.1 hypothetical protein C1141_16290 [Vibrio agarivorans]GEM76139.1 hypothetical protein VSA01S_22510 [Vibrio sagamiensis NBRC 104589]